MSHEIRTPMNGIIGGTELLLAADNNLNAEQKEVLGIIQHSSEAMLMLINDILDFSKIEAGRIQLVSEPIPIRDLLATTVNVLGQQALSKDLDLFVDVFPHVPHFILGDTLRIRQIILNLLSNAIKFTKAGQIVLIVDSEFIEDTGRHVIHFLVRDSGIGIPKNSRTLLFQKFSMLRDNASKQIGGTGLGLAISKSLVELMGGSMWISDEISDPDFQCNAPDAVPGCGPGAEFHFKIPCAGHNYPPEECPDNLCLKSPPFSGDQVLLIKKNKLIANMLTKIFSSWGMKTEFAPTLDFALENSLKFPKRFDYVLVDSSFLLSETPETSAERRDKALSSSKLTTSAFENGNPSYVFDSFKLKELSTRVHDLKSKLVVVVSLFHRKEQAQLEAHVDKLLSNPIKKPHLFRCLKMIREKNLEKDASSSDVTSTPMISEESTFAEQFPLTILIVEDNLVNQKIIKKMLVKLGYQLEKLEVADNGKIAVEKVRHRNSAENSELISTFFQVVFMYIFMPEMDGLEASVTIRKTREISPDFQPFIIALTANAMRGDQEKSEEAGMDLHVPKPVTVVALTDALVAAHRAISRGTPRNTVKK
eukprot:TRINITY_DN3782_c1_g4_i1.p1 TRINITY_DN3782_c1_g4~~TRINITY_DN3782_c1_g4_i1.p1  ORF type:complete len:603 (+),score=222.59 TRINITY_DN3782_c1_g4_i1:36-1811(+)